MDIRGRQVPSFIYTVVILYACEYCIDKFAIYPLPTTYHMPYAHYHRGIVTTHYNCITCTVSVDKLINRGAIKPGLDPGITEIQLAIMLMLYNANFMC